MRTRQCVGKQHLPPLQQAGEQQYDICQQGRGAGRGAGIKKLAQEPWAIKIERVWGGDDKLALD